MEKLYLIRRNLFGFLGPLTLNEVKDAFERMEFGLQDEISGNCSRWVPLDNHKMLKTFYPEVKQIMGKGLKDPWSSSATLFSRPPDKTAKIKFAKQARSSHRRRSSHKKNSMKTAITLAVLAIAIGLIGAYLVVVQNFNIPGIKGLESISVQKASDHFFSGDVKAFNEYMANNIKTIVTASNESPQEYNLWIPYIRAYAFKNKGRVPGLKMNALRGEARSAPTDCSLPTWKKRWNSSAKTMLVFVSAKQVVKNNWARLLAWEPHWILRRSSAGWFNPKSYYEACIQMAFRAFNEVSESGQLASLTSESQQLTKQIVADRLAWLSHIVSGTPKPKQLPSGTTKDILSHWTCLESSESFDALKKCKFSQPIKGEIWTGIEKHKVVMNFLRITLREEKRVSQKDLAELEKWQSELTRAFPYILFDLVPEQKYLSELITSRGENIRAVDNARAEYPNIDFRHLDSNTSH